MKLQTVLDGFVNVLTGLGVAGRDKRTGAVPLAPLILSRQELENMYSADDIVARLCDLPAKTMTRKWLELAGTNDPEAASEVIAAGRRMGIQTETRQAITWGRLFGSALIVMGIDDGKTMDQPVDESRIRKIDYLLVLDREDLQIRKTTEEFGENFGKPETYEILSGAATAITGLAVEGAGAAALLTQPIVHHTRVLRFDGVLTPKRRQRDLQGWNDSAVTRVHEVVRDFSQTYAGVAVAMQNLGTTVYRLKGLAKILDSDKDNLLLTRLQQLELAKSVTNSIPIDADGEGMDVLKQQLAGVDKILDRFDQRLAAAIGWPVTVLMGRSPAGMNATGENDLAIFYDTMEGDQGDLTPQLERFYRYLMLSSEGPTKGKELEGWAVKWAKLWQESQGDQAETRLKTAQTDALNITHEVYTADEAASSHYAGEEFSIEIDLDDEARESDKIEPAKEIPGVDLRDPTGEGGVGAGDETKPADEAMAAGQITALQGVLIAFNDGKITREQAISMLTITFKLEKAEAAELVGPEPEPKPEPTPPAFPPPVPGAPPIPPTAPEPGGPEPEPEPEPEDE